MDLRVVGSNKVLLNCLLPNSPLVSYMIVYWMIGQGNLFRVFNLGNWVTILKIWNV